MGLDGKDGECAVIFVMRHVLLRPVVYPAIALIGFASDMAI